MERIGFPSGIHIGGEGIVVEWIGQDGMGPDWPLSGVHSGLERRGLDRSG